MRSELDYREIGRSWIESFGFLKKTAEKPEVLKTNFQEFSLNNFFMNMPGGFYRDEDVAAVYEEGETVLQFLKRRAELEGREPQLEGLSVVKLHQTPDQFFETIDKAILKAGLDWDGVRLLNIAIMENDEHRNLLLGHLNTMIRPVYHVLRAWGYSPRDLLE